jgi:hypothetical protein
MSLQEKAALVSINITTWTAQKYDRKTTAQTNTNNNASNDAGRYNKHLIHKEALKSIHSVVGEARRYNEKNTSPWRDNGQRICPAKKLFIWRDNISEFKQKYYDHVDNFCDKYPLYVKRERFRLGDMYDPSEFPDVDFIRQKFSFNHSIMPLPSSGDFRIDIPQEELSTIQQQIQAEIDLAEKATQKDLWDRTHKVLNTLYDTLANPNKRVYESTVNGKVIELLGQIKDLNFSEDPQLIETAKLIEQDLTKLSPEGIKQDDLIRKEALDKTSAIMRKMAGFMGQEAA